MARIVFEAHPGNMFFIRILGIEGGPKSDCYAVLKITNDAKPGEVFNALAEAFKILERKITFTAKAK